MRSPMWNRKSISREPLYLRVDTYRDSLGGPMSHDLNLFPSITRKNGEIALRGNLFGLCRGQEVIPDPNAKW